MLLGGPPNQADELFLLDRELAALPGLDVDHKDRNPFGMTPSPFPPGEVVPVVLGGGGDYAAAESCWAVRLTRPSGRPEGSLPSAAAAASPSERGARVNAYRFLRRSYGGWIGSFLK